jgi:long-chain acyl-CoA synthetase
MTDKVWLKQYPKSVPAEIDYSAYTSITHLFETCCEKFKGLPAYSNLGLTISYAELEQKTRDFAAFLQSLPGLARGDRVAIMMPNLLQYPVAIFGVLRAGMIVVNVNPLYTPRELEHQLKDSGAKAIVIVENFATTLQQVIKATPVEHVITTQIGDMLPVPKRWIINFVIKSVKKMVPDWRIDGAMTMRSALARGAAATLSPVKTELDDLAFLQYTGGTTGVSKGAMLTHHNMLANTLQSASWLRSFVDDPDTPQTVLGALPFYHIFALTSIALLWMREGGHTLLITNPRDMAGMIGDLRKHACSVYYGVNTLFNGLLHTPGFETLDFRNLRSSIAGGMALQGAVADRWQAVTGCALSQGWGLTETSPVATMNPPRTGFNNSIGLPVPSTEISIRDEQGDEVALGEVGEICVRGPQVMRGYWNRPDETTQVMLPGGWLRTGDIGRMDVAGFTYIEDRKKDMILVSGFNVYPNEVEGVIARHPGVLEVAAVSQPDERSGEVVAVFVVRKDPGVTAADIVEFSRTELTGYKVPKHVYFREELPKTNVGKILRRALRDDVAKTP